MMARYRGGWIGPALVAISAVLVHRPLQAQNLSDAAQLSESVRVDEIDSATRSHLQRIDAYVAEEQWDEAVETLRQVMENHGERVVRLSAGRYISAREYCNLRLTMLPTEGLSLYRRRVDPLAKRWYDQALAARDAELLSKVVEQMFASSWGDDALYALGEIELECGHHSTARRYWEQISPQLKTRDGGPLWLALRGRDLDEQWAIIRAEFESAKLAAQWLAYPDTDLDLANVRARLALVSILEGSPQRAETELAVLARLHPGAKGRFAGQEVELAKTLSAYSSAAQRWPAAKVDPGWPTFAGDVTRTKVLPAGVDVAGQAWANPLELPGAPFKPDLTVSRLFRLSQQRTAEALGINNSLLSYHPLVVGDLLLVNDEQRIWAYNVRTGAPALSNGRQMWPTGEKLADKQEASTASSASAFGVPRFTMTADGNRLYARMGSPTTGRVAGESYADNERGKLICLNLQKEGSLQWEILPDDPKWAFEGPPVSAGEYIYVAMRYSDVRPQLHVACFDAKTGSRHWRRLVCAAESVSRGLVDEITHTLLTLHDDTLYVNTNLSAIAALSKHDGQVRWITTYPRAKPSQKPLYLFRDLNPVIYYQDLVLAAPTDSESILAIDALTGARLWESSLAEDAIHLLGVGAGNLLASGNRLWWLNVHTGKVICRWPDSEGPKGYGRGILAGDQVYWPTPVKVYSFDQAPSRDVGPLSRQPLVLHERQQGATGGNLLIAGDLLLIAGTEKVFALGPYRGEAKPAADAAGAPPEHEVAERAEAERQ